MSENKDFETKTDAEVINEKLDDATTPSYGTEFDPEEAEKVGAFVEDAISEEEALEAAAEMTFVIDDLDNIEIVSGGDETEPLPIPEKPNYVK